MILPQHASSFTTLLLGAYYRVEDIIRPFQPPRIPFLSVFNKHNEFLLLSIQHFPLPRDVVLILGLFKQRGVNTDE
jgi:hypothetical protein